MSLPSCHPLPRLRRVLAAIAAAGGVLCLSAAAVTAGRAPPPVPLPGVPEAACAFLESGMNRVAHNPASDVYHEGGEDPFGRDLPDAELGPDYGFTPRSSFMVPITAELSRFLAGPYAGFALEAQEVGRLRYHDGALYLNGRPLNAPARVRLEAACGQGSLP